MKQSVVPPGFTRVPNGILDTLSKYTLPAYETRILTQILRQTLGWNRLGYYTSLRDLGELCAMDYRHVGRALKGLEARRIVSTRIAKRNTHIEVNIDYMSWTLKDPPGLFTKKSMSQDEVDLISADANVLSPPEATDSESSPDTLSPPEATASVTSRGDGDFELPPEIAEITKAFHDKVRG